VLVDLRPKGIDGSKAERVLELAHIAGEGAVYAGDTQGCSKEHCSKEHCMCKLQRNCLNPRACRCHCIALGTGLPCQLTQLLQYVFLPPPPPHPPSQPTRTLFMVM
jgi:hypothetical protein